MPTYTIAAVGDQVREWSSAKGGAMKSYRVTLRNADGRELGNVEWSRKADSPRPEAGQSVEGEVDTSGQYGPKFKLAGAGGGGYGGGGGGRSKPPEERRSIAMQASQKVAVDVVRTACDGGLWKPESPDVLTDAVLRVAQRLFDQVQKAEGGA